MIWIERRVKHIIVYECGINKKVYERNFPFIGTKYYSLFRYDIVCDKLTKTEMWKLMMNNTYNNN